MDTSGGNAPALSTPGVSVTPAIVSSTPGSSQNTTTTTTTTTTTDGHKPIGPNDIKKNKYKFVAEEGIAEWGFSFIKKCLVCGLIYSLGYFQISTGWLVGPIVLMVIRDQWRRNHDAQRALATAAAHGDEREIVCARFGDNLPSWVIFPDVERAEWLNQMIKQLWPRINHYTYDLVVQTIEPGLRETLQNGYKLGSFRFEKIILGDTPFRVRGVKVYDEKKTDRNEIIMDLDIVYAGDCDFRFSVAKIKAGIKDLHLSGTLRLIMKPLINQIPLVGGVQYYFLNPPSLDFNLIGVADVFDMPGLSDLIRRIVQEQISSMCVLPNKMFIQLSDLVNPRETCATQPQGVVRICAVEARNLLKKDVGILGTGKSDPYIILSVGAQQHKSKVINNTVNPKWEFYCEMLVEEMGQLLNLVLYDHDDAPRTDEFLGRATVDLNVVRREGSVDVWLELEDVKKGQVHLRLTWLTFTENPADLKDSLIETQNAGLSSAILTVRVDSARNLPTVKEGSKPDPYAVLSVGKRQQESVTLEKTTDPVYEETFHFLVHNPLTDTLLLKMMDRKTSHEIGSLKQSLDMIFSRPHLTLEKQNFSLTIKNDAKVTLDMRIRILKAGKDIIQEDIDDDDEFEEQNQKNNTNPGTKSLVDTTSLHEESKKLLSDIQSNGSEPKIVTALLTENNATLSANDFGNVMKIRLTIRYSSTNQTLVAVVHTVNNLPIEKEELPDPYVKLYVLPEKSKKLKTEAQKDQINPLYDERFDFPILDLRGKILHVQVCDKKIFKSNPLLGQVFIPLDEFQMGNALTNWYPLST